MKRNLTVILKVTLLLAVSFAISFTFINGYYFSGSILSVALCILTFSFVSYQRKLSRKIENMISRIQHGDMNVSFPEDPNDIVGNLNHSMNKALSAFRSRLYNSIVSEAEIEAWQKLIRVLAHEIMNSLAPIISLSETMSERGDKQNPNPKEYAVMLEAMQSIHRRSTGLLHFVENYRKLTRIPEPIMRYFSIQDLFRDLRQLMGNDGIAIEFSVRPQELRLYADRGQIEQVILNLLKNATEAAKGQSGVQISVRAYTDQEKTYIDVTDNGPGIVPESLDKIFVPFYTTKQTGSGIGLSLSRQIMNRHNGNITVKSQLNKGTVFSLVFN